MAHSSPASTGSPSSPRHSGGSRNPEEASLDPGFAGMTSFPASRLRDARLVSASGATEKNAPNLDSWSEKARAPGNGLADQELRTPCPWSERARAEQAGVRSTKNHWAAATTLRLSVGVQSMIERP